VSGGQIAVDAGPRAPAVGIGTGDPDAQAGGRTVRHDRRNRRLAIVGVALAMLLGGALRAAWASAYLPWQHHWDEITNVRVGETMADERAIDPGFYNYPALVFLAETAVLISAEVVTDFEAGRDPVLETQTAASARVAEPGVLRALRWSTGVVPGMVMVATAGALAWTASRRWSAATCAGLVAALSALDLRFGVVVTPDALSGMAAGLAALGAVGVALHPSRRRYLVTGAAVGLAAAAKYNGAAVAIGLLAAHVVAHRGIMRERRMLLEAAGVAAAVFCLANLGAVLHPVELAQGIGSEANHYSTGHFGDEGASPAFNARWLWRSFGPMLAFAPCALLSTSDRVRRAAVVLLAQSAGYYVFISLFPVRFARNLLPMTAPLAAAAALGLVALVQRTWSWSAGRPVRAHRTGAVALAVAMTAVFLTGPVLGAGDAMRSLDEDPWSDAQAWVARNVPAGSKIVIEDRSPVIDEDRYEVVVRRALGHSAFSQYTLTGVDYVVAVSETFGPFLDAPDEYPDVTGSYRELLAPDCVVHEFEGAGQRIVIASPPACRGQRPAD
jgi:Dolichyl-phosphate-mannose-protein mannosyltransferase